MKKLLSAVLVIMLLAMSVIGVSAAGDLNAYEQQILDLLATKIEVGESHAEIPAEYIAQAKNYFMTLDVTEQQSKEIIAILEEGIETGKKALEDAEKVIYDEYVRYQQQMGFFLLTFFLLKKKQHPLKELQELKLEDTLKFQLMVLQFLLLIMLQAKSPHTAPQNLP